MTELRFDAETTTKESQCGLNGHVSQPASKTITSDDISDLLEQVLTSHKGLGMIATQEIKRGTRIINEESILTIENDRNSDKHLLQKFLRLSPYQHNQLAKLSGDEQKLCPRAYATFTRELENYHQYSGRYLAAAAHDFARMHAIFYANAVMLGSDAHFSFGVFPLTSRLNHSCTPNVQKSFNSTIGRKVVHAIKDIPKGEEIVTSYIPLQLPATLRFEDLIKKWGFKCKCETCCGTDQIASEYRRQRLYEIDQGFAFLDKPINDRTYASAILHDMVPNTDGQALRWAEESVELLKIEGLVGMDMAKAYRECSKYSLHEGQLERALDYARKELDVQMTCLGEEAAHLSPEDDANVWIKHIEGMSEADNVRMRMDEKRVQKEEKKLQKKVAKRASKR